jgi:hypothetical protein
MNTSTDLTHSTHKAFLSYQSADKQFVEVLGTCLRSNGVDVFFDKWDIPGGGSIPGEIEVALSEDELFIYVLSPASTESKWVEAEYHAFLYRKLNEHSLRIIPVLRKDCIRPAFIAPLKYIDFRFFDNLNESHRDPSADGPLKELLASIYRTPVKPPLGAPHPSLASYEFYFQKMKNPPKENHDQYWEFGFKNLTDGPLHNFTFAVVFDQPVKSVRYDFKRSSSNMTGGDGLSDDRKRFHWLGNQIMDDGGWVVFVVKSQIPPVIKRISTKLLGRVSGSKQLIPPDLNGLRNY